MWRRTQRSTAALARGADPAASPGLRLAQTLTAMIVLLAAVASASGLLVPGLYKDPAAVLPAIRGQDLITLLALPVLVMAVSAAHRGSARATVLWIGLLGYIFYTYTGAAFAYHFNGFLLIYIALFSLSLTALVAAAVGLDVARLRGRFDATTPRGPVVAFLVLLAFMLTTAWLGQIVQAVAGGTVPEIVKRAQTSTNYVYALDLGLIVPLALLAAVWLWRQLPWGYLVAGFLLIKGATMGLALLSMTGFTALAGLPVKLGETIGWAVLALAGLGLSFWFLRHCHDERARPRRRRRLFLLRSEPPAEPRQTE